MFKAREFTHPTLGKGKSSSKCHVWGICLFPEDYLFSTKKNIWSQLSQLLTCMMSRVILHVHRQTTPGTTIFSSLPSQHRQEVNHFQRCSSATTAAWSGPSNQEHHQAMWPPCWFLMLNEQRCSRFHIVLHGLPFFFMFSPWTSVHWHRRWSPRWRKWRWPQREESSNRLAGDPMNFNEPHRSKQIMDSGFIRTHWIHGTGIFTYTFSLNFFMVNDGNKCRQIYQSHGSYGKQIKQFWPWPSFTTGWTTGVIYTSEDADYWNATHVAPIFHRASTWYHRLISSNKRPARSQSSPRQTPCTNTRRFRWGPTSVLYRCVWCETYLSSRIMYKF